MSMEGRKERHTPANSYEIKIATMDVHAHVPHHTKPAGVKFAK